METKVKKLAEDYSVKVEAHLRTKIKPKPKWLPDFIWKWLLNKLFFLEEFNPTR